MPTCARADQLHVVIQMPEQRFGPALDVAQIFAGARDRHQPTGIRACGRLHVIDIAKARVHGIGVRMADHHGPLRHRERVERRPPSDVTQVDEHADALGLLNEAAAVSSEPAVDRARRTAAAGAVGVIEGQQRLAHTQRVERIDEVQVTFEAARAFELQHHGELADAFRGDDVLHRSPPTSDSTLEHATLLRAHPVSRSASPLL